MTALRTPSSLHATLPDAVVFDLDGTLVDSAPDIHAAVNAFLAERGHAPLDLATVVSFIGNGVPTLLQRVLTAVGKPAEADHVDAVLPRFHAIYGAAPSALSRLYPGVRESLEVLKAAGLRLGICTNKPAEPARQVIADLGLSDFFAALVGGDSLPQRKPDPAPLFAAARQLDVSVATLAYVGDSEVDAATAQTAQAAFVLFTEGYRKSAVDAIPHQARFSHYRDLWSRLAALPVRHPPAM